MKSRSCASNSIRGPGQRSISSTFLFRPLPKWKFLLSSPKFLNLGHSIPISQTQFNSRSSSMSEVWGSDGIPSTSSSHGHPRLSLSAFLDGKLHFTSVLTTRKDDDGKLSPSLEKEHPNGSVARGDQNRSEGPRKEKGPTIEDSVFKLFSDKQGGKVGERPLL